MDKIKGFLKSKWIFVLLLLIISVITLVRINGVATNSKAETVKYTEFEKLLEENEIQNAVINLNSPTFVFFNKKGDKFITDNPRTANFKEMLLKKNVDVQEQENSDNKIWTSLLSSIISIIIWIGVISFVLKGTFKSITPIQNDAKQKRTTSNVKFCDVAGNTEQKTDMMNLVNFVKEPKKYTERGAKLPKGVIFYGPPGTGKTLMAQAIAGEAGVPFFYMNASEFVEMYVGVGAKRVREFFGELRKNAPCIGFVDELEALAEKSGTDNNSERKQTIKQFLAELDGFKKHSGILIIGATNNLEALDETFIRSGRFDRKIAFGLPDLKDRLEILKLHSKDKVFAEDIKLEQLAKLTRGCSGADLETILNEATIISVNKGNAEITNEDIRLAFEQTIMKGQRKQNDDRKAEDAKLVAWHEAGHAVMAKLAGQNVPMVTIVPSTSGAGGVTFHVDDIYLRSKKDLINDIYISYAGRVAEYLLRDNEDLVTTGASSDIEHATKIIRAMIEKLGMGEFGLMNLEVNVTNSEALLREEVNFSKKLYNDTVNILTKNKHLIEAVANALIEKETLDENELNEIMGIDNDNSVTM